MPSTIRPHLIPQKTELRVRDERLESLGLLAGHVAHDFNNLLAPILGYSTLIKEEFPPDSTGQQFAASLESSARRVEKVLEQTLLATRPQRKFSPREHALDQVIASEAALWQAELPATSGVSLSVRVNPCTLVADEFHWRIVTRHLLNNARYGCATGGQIDLSLKAVTLSSEERLALGLPDGDLVRLQVTDDGFGMTPEVMARAFEPFFTSRPKGAAQGLGLTACHSITYLHGGQIELASTPDRGTVATLWLPLQYLSARSAISSTESTPRPQDGTPRRRRVLMVDDDPLIREVVKTALIKAGYEVLTADDGEAAWKMFSRFHRELTAVLSDFRMPVLDGVQLLRQMRELNSAVPVILLTGDTSGDLENKLSENNLSVEVIRKPFPLSQLIARMTELPR